jgi:CAAX protease family protein
VSSPPNPLSEPLITAGTTAPPPPTVDPSLSPTVPENPPWTGWEVLALAVATFVAMVICILAVGFALRPYVAPHQPWTAAMTRPEVIVGGQLFAYTLLFLLMYAMVRNHTDGDVFAALRWNWPTKKWGNYLLAGLLLAICLVPFEYFLPIPKKLPVDEFFKTARDAYILSIFGIFFAPLFEELFFRGFLYPVLARRLGMGASIFITSVFFAGIHGSQLKYSWAPVLMIFIVGVTLTTVRALKKSVAATTLMHMAYNGTIFIATFIATDGFRHMERFNQ